VPEREDAAIVTVLLCAAGHRTKALILLGQAVHGGLPFGPPRTFLAHLLLRAASRVVELDEPRRQDHHLQKLVSISDVDRDEAFAGLEHELLFCPTPHCVVAVPAVLDERVNEECVE